jgi:hypothetical protein
VLYPKRIAAERGTFSWHEAVLKNVPPLTHRRGSRWPLVTWEGLRRTGQTGDHLSFLLQISQFFRTVMYDPVIVFRGSFTIHSEGRSIKVPRED